MGFRIHMNEKPVEHHARGPTFRCERADFRGVPIMVSGWDPVEDKVLYLMQAVADFTAWHRGNIFEHLNGFSGYGALQFEFGE